MLGWGPCQKGSKSTDPDSGMSAGTGTDDASIGKNQLRSVTKPGEQMTVEVFEAARRAAEDEVARRQ